MRNTLIDAGPIIALFDKSDGYHEHARSTLKQGDFRLTTTWPVMTEARHMLDFDVRAQLGLLQWIYRGGVKIHEIDTNGLHRIITLTEKYRDRPMDLADATLVVAAEDTGIREILSIDSDFPIYRTGTKESIENVFTVENRYNEAVTQRAETDV